MSASDVRTTGYRLADGRYFIVKDKCGKIVSIRQVLFGCGIYPAPVKDVPKNEWPEVLTMTSFSECYKKGFREVNIKRIYAHRKRGFAECYKKGEIASRIVLEEYIYGSATDA